MQTTSYSLGELLRRVRDQDLTIPQFQRKFIWRESQVKLLIDSISRSYPIGSLLILDKKPDLPLASRSIEAEIREGYPPGGLFDNPERQTEMESYILDGQQRTTSIARVFLNAHPKKLYYFDLKSMLESHSQEETSWIRVRARRKTEPDRKDNNRLLRADLILDQTKADIYVSEYMEDSGDFPEFDRNRAAARRAAAFIKGIFETIRNYKVPVVTLDRDRGVESICRVFETINSTGTRLRTFDLAVARFFPEPDLRKLWEDALERYPILENFEVDGERVLQVLCLVLAGREDQYPEPSRNNQLALGPDAINREWTRSSEALAITYQWAQAQGARPETLPNHNVLVALAGVRSLFSSEDLSREIWPDNDFIRRWYFSKVIQAGASQASNYRIGQDFSALRRYIKEGIQPHPEEVVLNLDIILKIKPSDVRYKSLQNVFATTIRQDLISGGNINSESKLHDHHIYPRNAHKKYDLPPRMLDSICNRIPILATSNQSLNEGYPQEYFKRLADQARAQGTLDGLQRRLRDCMIPGNPGEMAWSDSFAIDKFEEFCRRRAELIVSRVREIIGESLKVSSLSDDEMAEEDED